MAEKVTVLSENQLENVSGGSRSSGSPGSGDPGSSQNTTLKCPSCGVKGPHTYHLGGRVTCDNCGHTYMA